MGSQDKRLTSISFQMTAVASMGATGRSRRPEPEEEREEDDSNAGTLLDLSARGVEKLSRAAPEWQLDVTTLVLDGNKLQRLDNIHTFQCIEKVSDTVP